MGHQLYAEALLVRSARPCSSSSGELFRASALQWSAAEGAMGLQWQSRYPLIVLLVLASLALPGCEVIGGIFKAGVWVGVIGVVIVLAIVAFIAAKVRG